MIGVPAGPECSRVSRLIAIKLFFNEFVAYQKLIEENEVEELSARTNQIAVFALCGFANFSSVAIITGSAAKLNSSLSNERINSTVWKALLIGVLTSLFNATVAGLIHPPEIETFGESKFSGNSLNTTTKQ